MRPYSMDLRERVAAAVDHEEGSLRQIARTFRVSLSFIARLLRRRRRTGSLVPKSHGGGHPPALDREHLKQLRRLVRKRPDATLEQLRQRLGVPCSRMAIWRALRGRKITRKKKVLHAQQRDAPAVRKERKAFREEVAVLDPRRLVFVDETGATSALRLSGVMAPLAFEGATDTAAFQTYVEQALVPQLRPGDVVVWVNLKPHKHTPVVQAVERAGARVEPLPPYSFDLTPIEKMSSKVKGLLKSAAARTTEAVYNAMGAALRAVCPEDILGWFRSCGLCAKPARTRPDDLDLMTAVPAL